MNHDVIIPYVNPVVKKPYEDLTFRTGLDLYMVESEILGNGTNVAFHLQQWLIDTVVEEDGQRNYYWNVGNIIKMDNNMYRVSNDIAFRYEEDLVAFRLRWGSTSP